MAMIHLGAKGDTAKQIDDTFMFSNIEDGKFHSAFGELHGVMFDKVERLYVLVLSIINDMTLWQDVTEPSKSRRQDKYFIEDYYSILAIVNSIIQ